MNRWEEKQEDRRDRLQAAADRAASESDARHKTGHDLAYQLNGQPILIGHHSEQACRAAYNRIDTNFRKSSELYHKAKDLTAKAEAVGRGGISSEDDAAIQKLTAKLARLEAERKDRKALNAFYRKHDTAKGFTFGDGHTISDENAATIDAKMIEQKAPGASWVPDKHKIFPGYWFTNAGATIRQVKQRIANLTAEAERRTEPAQDDKRQGFRFYEDREEERACIEFDKRPSRETCKMLRTYGWKWSPNNVRWQRLLNDNARSSWQHYVAPELEKVLP